MEIKRIIGQCVDEMALEPNEVKVTIQQKTPEMVSPGVYQRVVAGAPIHRWDNNSDPCAVIPSIGAGANPLLAQTTPDMQFTKRGYIAVESEATGRTTKKGVFADGEWWDPNAPKPAEAAPAAK